MKKIIKKFWGVAFVVVLISSLFLTGSSASALPCFSYAPLPSATAGSPMGITAYGTEIYDFAVAQTNADVIWAATSDNALMSVDQGRTWQHVFTGNASGDDYTRLVCIAPDDANVVVYVSNLTPAADALRTVKISMNAGLSWFDLGTPHDLAGNDVKIIRDVDISREFTDLYGYTYRYIAVVGSNNSAIGTDGAAALYYCKIGAWVPMEWRNAVTDNPVAGQGYDGLTDQFFAVKFSPAFNIDNILYVMGQDGTAVEAHVCSLNIEGRFDWKITGFGNYPPAGVTAINTLIPGPDVISANVVKGQIIFSPTYNGVLYDPQVYPRVAYWSCSTAEGGSDGNYGIISEDQNGTPSAIAMYAGIGYWSIALDAAGVKLLAGKTDYTSISGALGPNAKYIGGGTESFGGISDAGSSVTLFYAGANLLGAKQNDQGAFSLSLDNGYTWNDISLVNTDMDYIDDFAVEAAGVLQYIVSHGNSNSHDQWTPDSAASVWYYDGTYWERVYVRASLGSPNPDPTVPGLPADAHRYQIKASPDNFAVVYLADTANATIYYTPDNGKLSWRTRSAPISNTSLVDIEVVDDADLYAATNVGANGYVCPLTYSGQYWNASDYIPVFGAGTNIFSITLVSDEEVIAGSMAPAGKVAYTTTGGNTPPEWTVLPGVVTGGNVITEAVSLAAGSMVYAASTAPSYAGVSYYVIGSTASSWASMYAPCADNYTVDIFIYGTGIGKALYYLSGNNTGITATMSLNRSFLDLPGWCGLCQCPGWAGRTPDALKGTAPGNTLWWIDRWGATIWLSPMRGFGETLGRYDQIPYFTDVNANLVPVITGPANGYVVQVNKETGIAYDITLTWVGGPAYVVVSKSADFLDVKAAGCTGSPVNIGPHAINSAFIVNWQPGETYYIKIRYSCACPGVSWSTHWSDVVTINIMATPLPIPELYAPACGGEVTSLTPGLTWSPMAGTSTYTVQLGTGPNLDNPSYLLGSWQVTNTTGYEVEAGYLLDGSTYYWRVASGTAAPFKWSPTCSFTVRIPTEPPTFTTTIPTPQATETVPVPTNADQTTVNQVSTSYIWAVIIIGAVLVVAIIVLIFRTRAR